MGGLACIIPRNAILTFDGVPTDQRKFSKFDAQLRACCAQPGIVDGIAAQGESKGRRVCELLAKRSWTLAERTELYDILEDLEY